MNVRIIATLTLLLATAALGYSTSASALPDNRGYELVSPVDKNGVELGDPVSSRDGNSVNWQSLGALGDATSGSLNLYQARRTATGWQTTGLTPTPTTTPRFLEFQAPMQWSIDLTKSIFFTEQSYDPGDEDHGGMDLYMRGPDGKVSWISKGSQGGTAPRQVTFDYATPDEHFVAFSTEESLTPDATGMAEGGGSQVYDYLYVRDVATAATHLVNVDDSDALIGTEGALLGNGYTLQRGEPPDFSYLPADGESGTTTHAVSNDGSKVFFEVPLPNSFTPPLAHLYMREDNARTVPIDDPQSAGSATYEGAAEDGSVVVFTSDEGLGGDPFTDRELYAFNTSSRQVTPISAGTGSTDGQLYGVTAISNDGSHVYFVAGGVLAGANARTQQPVEGEPNLYVYDTHSGLTSFIATLLQKDVVVSESSQGGPLVVEPDYLRVAQPTPDGSVLVFDSATNLTGQNPGELFEVYRYSADSGALTCVSCPSHGIAPTGNATMSGSGGGSYGPPDGTVTMSADGSRIFFDSEEALVPEDINTTSAPRNKQRFVSGLDVYEWANGQVSLISDGQTSTPTILSGTTPSGNDVFIYSDVGLVAQDTDGSFDIYDARVGGGFPEPTPPPAPQCSGTDCHPSGPPPTFGIPASVLLQEGDNLTPPPAPKSTSKSTKKPTQQTKKKKKKKKKKSKPVKKTRGKKTTKQAAAKSSHRHKAGRGHA